MTTREIIQEIQQQNPLISQQQILSRLEIERARTGNLLSDETLLRLIAAKLGVQLKLNSLQISGVMPINRLMAGLSNVTIAGRLIAICPVKSFQGAEKSGKLASLIVADNEGILRVVLWDEQVELIEKGELKTSQTVRLHHGYTKQDFTGKIELHLGKKSKIEIEKTEKTNNYKFVEKFFSKIATLSVFSGNVFLGGTIKEILGKNNFSRTGLSSGKVMRLRIADDSAQINVVVWNEKVEELENVVVDSHLQLFNAHVKGTQNGNLEAHVDSSTAIILTHTSQQENC